MPLNAAVSGGNLLLNWPGVAGQTYQLESTTNLTSGVWTPVGGSVTGTGATLTLTNSLGASPQLYFRLQLVN